MDIKGLVQELGNLLVLRDIAKALHSASAVGNDHAMTLLSAALLVTRLDLPSGPNAMNLSGGDKNANG